MKASKFLCKWNDAWNAGRHMNKKKTKKKNNVKCNANQPSMTYVLFVIKGTMKEQNAQIKIQTIQYSYLCVCFCRAYYGFGD